MQPESSGTTPARKLATSGRTEEIQDADSCFELTEIEEIVRRHVGERSFVHWFDGRATFSSDSDELVVGVGSPFLVNWTQKQFRKPLTAAAVELLGPSARIRLCVDRTAALASSDTAGRPPARSPNAPGSSDNELPKADATVKADVRRAVAHVARSSTGGTTPVTSTGRRRFANLDDFVTGPCNELPALASRQVCEMPGDRFNPLYLHGGAGLGKTHLLEGIYRQIRKQHPHLQVTYLTAEAFINYYTDALRNRTIAGFRQKFRTVDVLLIDDVDFLDGKRSTSEELLHTCKQLESHGRQVVVSAGSHPRLLKKVSNELASWFLSGLVCRLEAPHIETRRRIVELKAGRMDGHFTRDAMDYVARRFRSNVRELEGAINCLDTWHAVTKQRINEREARRILMDLERDCERVLRIIDVEQTVCEFFGLDQKTMRSSDRSRTISQPRMLAMFLARKHTAAAYSEIGKHFGNRNRSTVLSAERRVQSWLADGTRLKVATQAWSVGELIETLEERMLAG